MFLWEWALAHPRVNFKDYGKIFAKNPVDFSKRNRRPGCNETHGIRLPAVNKNAVRRQFLWRIKREPGDSETCSLIKPKSRFKRNNSAQNKHFRRSKKSKRLQQDPNPKRVPRPTWNELKTELRSLRTKTEHELQEAGLDSETDHPFASF